MKTPTLLCSIALTSLCLTNCGTSNYSSAEAEMASNSKKMADSVNMESDVQIPKAFDTTRLFIRTADMKFKVRSVNEADQKINELIEKLNGFVLNQNVSSSLDKSEYEEISADSIQRISFYTMQSSISFRIPNEKINQFINETRPLITYLDYKNINANDVSVDFLRNKLTVARNKDLVSSIAQTKPNSNKENSLDPVYAIKQAREEAEIAHVNNLDLMDKVNYSTLTIMFYEPLHVAKEREVNSYNMDSFKTSFFNRLGHALYSGWRMLLNVIIFFAEIWYLILLAFLALYAFRRYKSSNKAK